MSLKERIYRFLIVSSSDKFNTAVSACLPESKYSPIKIVSTIHAAKQVLTEYSFDHIIINAPLPDDFGLHFAIDTCSIKETVVLLIVSTELYDEVYDKAASHGVFVLSKPTAKPAFFTALSFMASARERFRTLEKKTLSIEEKMEEIRIVNRAKWILISELKMDEPGAHRYIEKQAMDQCVTRKSIAEQIIKMYS